MFALAVLLAGLAESYWVGVGMADTTGPASDVCLMGYANPAQIAGGIHFRLRARAFVVGDDENKDRFAYVSLDAGMGSQAITREVLNRLARRFPGQYSQRNLFISGTHTHAAPGGFSQYVIHQIGSDGFVPETFEAYVRGIVEAITRAHTSALPKSKLYFGLGKSLPGSNINRSPSGYRANPIDEQTAYEKDGGNTDKIFSLLKIARPDDVPIGMFNWFAVHGTSMPNDNKLISGDNKGYASQLFESWLNGKHSLPGQGPFVAAFAATNLGDVSPNVNGTFCQQTKLPCEELHSTCKGWNEFCHGVGPAADPFESTRIIGERQAYAALSAFANARDHIDDSGSVWSGHRVVDFSRVKVDLARVGQAMFPYPKTLTEGDYGFSKLETNKRRRTSDFLVTPPEWTQLGVVETCKSALGYSFAAGTTDGPGAFDFYQGEIRGKPFWEFVRSFLKRPSNETVRCQAPKPVLLATGEINEPYPWEPSVMSIGLSIIGKSFAILSVPSEFSTMAGRRLKRAVKRALVEGKRMNSNGMVVLSCLTNAYSHYVVTYEEYQVQRYEAASTLFGPHTLAAYVQEFLELVNGNVSPTKEDSRIPDYTKHPLILLPEAGVDGAHAFGQVFKAPTKNTFKRGEKVTVSFHSANLRHDTRMDDTFLTVERLDAEDEASWLVVATDSSFETKLYYHRTKLGHSFVDVEWSIPLDAKPGTYRISHRAAYKEKPHSRLVPFVGFSRPFLVQ
jgi:neutral ceramidase